jgi:multidrug efflux pump subunit AcrB
LSDGKALRFVDQGKAKYDLWTLDHELQVVDSTSVAFPTFTTLSKQKVSTNIHKQDQQYIRMVEFEYTGSARFGSLYLEEVVEIMKKEMPLGYSLERSTWRFGEEKQKPYWYFLLIVVLIFAICAVLFESLRQAFNIVLLIPLSFIGIFLTFYWFDFPFDQGGYTSFLFVSGIVVNGLILILNDFNHFQKQHPNRSSLSLYIKAFNHKIVPVLLTVVSTSLGLIPFLVYGQQEVFWFSLAVGSIGGLLFSMFVVFLFTPIFFLKKKNK